MPQMAPSNWISLFITFLLTFLMFSNLIYYLYIPTIKKSFLKIKKTNTMNWKW